MTEPMPDGADPNWPVWEHYDEDSELRTTLWRHDDGSVTLRQQYGATGPQDDVALAPDAVRELATQLGAPANAPHGPQDATGTVRADTEPTCSGTGPQTGAQPCERHPDAPTIGGHCGQCTIRPTGEDEVVEITVDTSRLDAALADAANSLDRVALRGRIAEALCDCSPTCGGTWPSCPSRAADAVLAVVQPQLDREAEASRLLVQQRQELAAENRLIDGMRQANLDAAGAAIARAETAEATVRRVRDACDAIDGERPALEGDFGDGCADAVARIRAALDRTEQ